ncbi:MAG: PDZ domain-containing protein [Bacteroidota bacterium]
MQKKWQITIGALLFAVTIFAQERDVKKEEVIIRREGKGKEVNMTVMVKGDSVFVNGKPVQEGDGTIITRKKIINDGEIEETSAQAFLGVNIEWAENGVRIVSVTEGSNAEKAGLKTGDIILSLAGKTEKDPEAFRNLVRAQKPMDEVEIIYIPSGEKKEKKIKVKLGSMMSMSKILTYTLPGSNFEPGDFDMKVLKNLPNELGVIMERELGSMVNTNKPQLGIKIQDTEDNKGVNVLAVTEQSLAAKAGVQVHDILIAIDGKEVDDTDAAREALQLARDKSFYIIKVNRAGMILELTLKAPKQLKEANL